MLRSLSVLSLVLIVALFSAGCSDQSTPTSALQPEAASALSPDLAASKNGPPEDSGPHIIRYQDTFAYAFVDPKTNVAAVFGLDLPGICSDGPDDADFDLLSYSELQIPEDANRIHWLVQGDDVHASVWDPAPPTLSCTDIMATSPLATGYADLVYTDNDVNVFLNPDNVNANAYGISAHGKLQSPEGETVHVNAHRRCVWDGTDVNASPRARCQVKVNVH